MNRRFGRLPPLTTLEGFEAAARLGSFSDAADELGVTQSAISHQMKLLEDYFHQPLFTRTKRTVELTDAGKDFLGTATQTLEILARGKNRLDYYVKPGSVVITTTSSFASKWLVPRLSDLKKAAPTIQPWLHCDDTHFFLQETEIDFAIWYGNGNWPNVEVTKLFHDYLTPLAAPGYLDDPTTEGLRETTLLHDERKEDWQAWLHQSGMGNIDSIAGFNFSDPGLMLESAAAGQGIALGSLVLAHNLILDGKLARPFEEFLKTEKAYYLVVNPQYKSRKSVLEVLEWLKKEADSFTGKLPAFG